MNEGAKLYVIMLFILQSTKSFDPVFKVMPYGSESNHIRIIRISARIYTSQLNELA